MLLISFFIFLFLTTYKVINKCVILNEKQKAHVIEFIWSIVLVSGSLKTFCDIYKNNELLDIGYTNTTDVLLKLYMAGTITDFYLCYNEYHTYFTKVTISHHIIWIGISCLTLYTNASIYAAFVYLIEIPCIPKCIFKLYPKLKNTLVFAKTWIVFRIFYFINIVIFFQKRFKEHNPLMYKLVPLWWAAWIMHLWWGVKLVKKCESEERIWSIEDRKTYLINKENRPYFRGFIQHILMKYYIIHCFIIMYCYYVSYDPLKWYYYFNALSIFLNTYASYKLHCNDLFKNTLEDEGYYWKIDEFSINSLIFSRFILLTNIIVFPQFIVYSFFIIYLLNCINIYNKNNIIKYNFSDKQSFPTHYMLSHMGFVIMYLISGYYSFYMYEHSVKPLIGWLVYLLAFLIYYSKFCFNMNNKLFNQHDIIHLIINLNYLFYTITDII